MRSLLYALCALTLVCALATPAEATQIQLTLNGRAIAEGGGNAQHGYGSHGMYLGNSRWGYRDHRYTNFTWEQVDMTIYENGDALINGEMTRHDGSVWGMEIKLFDMEFRGSIFNGETTYHSGMMDDLLSAGVDGAGFEWDRLEMSLTAPYFTGVPLEGWVGYAMPNMGHYNPAELHWTAEHGLAFDAWYKNPGNCGFYRVGDSKLNAGVVPVPEPASATLFVGGMLLVAGALRRNALQAL